MLKKIEEIQELLNVSNIDKDILINLLNNLKLEVEKLLPKANKRYDKMVFKPPFRVGKKQGKAVLDSNGLLVTFFEHSESQALLFCDYLNSIK